MSCIYSRSVQRCLVGKTEVHRIITDLKEAVGHILVDMKMWTECGTEGIIGISPKKRSAQEP